MTIPKPTILMKTVRKMMPIGERETVLEGCMRTEKSFSQREHEATLESVGYQLQERAIHRPRACAESLSKRIVYSDYNAF
jgi:hypothetical protein